MRLQTALIEKGLAYRLHPRLAKWLRATYPTFTQAQLLCVPAILDRQSILLTSPSGQWEGVGRVPKEPLQDLDDLAVIARRKNEPTIPLAEVKRRLKKNGAPRR